ncbi:hypothetical protein K470DRAFT_259693 [Piedraia hortae CBS 480.64]|uniref:Uncharacterized protein n=1 Tax=Piedraia hortae CBS 480.64 TaxID=1314780 RepID=A0A6A7BTP3_9PEZI|nr:hypothetical protein K470DRAFT_259693 [Piedraia hortae CBS 480.64]
MLPPPLPPSYSPRNAPHPSHQLGVRAPPLPSQRSISLRLIVASRPPNDPVPQTTEPLRDPAP